MRFTQTFLRGGIVVASIALSAAAATSSISGCGGSDPVVSTPHNQLIAAAACETCAVEEGAVTCFGQLTPSLMPANPLPDGSAPTKVPLPGPAVLIAVGPDQVCAALDQQEGVYCWGLNDVGQLGVPLETDPTKPMTTPVKTTFSPSAKSIVAGEGFTCVLDSNGLVKCAGGRIDGTLGNGKGMGNMPVSSDIPIGVPSLGSITQLVGGQRHACTLDSNSVVSCWGSNKNGQCGQKDNDTVEFPATVSIDSADKIWSGLNTTCAHTTANEVWCWGDNSAGIEGDATMDSTPRKVTLDKYAQLALGGTRACGVDPQGNVDCWGQEIALKPMKVDPPTTIGGFQNPNLIVSGASHHCAWSSGQLYCWGENNCGQTGLIGGIIQMPSTVPL